MNSEAEIRITRIATGLTLIAATLAFWGVTVIALDLVQARDWLAVVNQAIFAGSLLVLIAGGLAYQVARAGYVRHTDAHTAEDVDALEAIDVDDVPALAVLVPAYKESPGVVRRTLISAALQRYARRRVVLLIDDPCNPRAHEDAANLEAMRALPAALEEIFDAAATHFDCARSEFEQRVATERWNAKDEAVVLAKLWSDAAEWLDREIERQDCTDHSAALLVNHVLIPCRDAHQKRARYFRDIGEGGLAVDVEAASREYRRLAALFRVAFSSFERKRYDNLSHEPNKAMNLNSYLSGMGSSFQEVPGADGTLRLERTGAPGAIDIADAEFVLTLDADSVLLPDYAFRLARILMKPGNERVAVAQTPYSAFPNAPGLLERTAGAQTDIQYLMHQGFTHNGATFWVGANALLRKAALEDIATEHIERGHRVMKYIQDRTVIEDTESTIDMVDRDWTLYNHPQRLAFSATPPDFGSLAIQRQRWANGGLIILPKALRYLARGPLRWAKVVEAFLRVHYLASVAAVNTAFLLIMFGPFERNLHIVWVPLSMIPYMALYARDLLHCGYRWVDFPRVYALNLLLLPVNLGGTLRSLYQALTGKRAAFGRTPKVSGRTAAHGTYVLAEYALFGAALVMGVMHVLEQKWLSAVFAGTYVAFMSYAVVRFVGLRESVEDLRLWLRPVTEVPRTLEIELEREVAEVSAPRRDGQL